MKYITWDIGIIAVACILLAYSFLIKRHKALASLVSVYIAYLVVLTWGDKVVGLFVGDRVVFNSVWIKSNAPSYVIQAITFVSVSFILMNFLKLSGKRSKYSLPEITVYSICAVALATVYVISFLPLDVRNQVVAGSKIVPYLYNYREWVVLAPVLVMIFFGLYHDDD